MSAHSVAWASARAAWVVPVVALAALAALVVGAPPSVPVAHAQTQPECRFVLGFATLRTLVGPEIVGDCLEDERFNPANGNAEQQTTGGLLVWRQVDNWTAFTNGTITWLLGPCGLQTRPNEGPFYPWEGKIGSPCVTLQPGELEPEALGFWP